MSDKPIHYTEADTILMEAGRWEDHMTDQQKLDAINEITGKDYNRIDHSDEARAI